MPDGMNASGSTTASNGVAAATNTGAPPPNDVRTLNRPVFSLALHQKDIRGNEFGCSILTQNMGTSDILLESVEPSFCEGVELREICGKTTYEVRLDLEKISQLYREFRGEAEPPRPRADFSSFTGIKAELLRRLRGEDHPRPWCFVDLEDARRQFASCVKANTNRSPCDPKSVLANRIEALIEGAEKKLKKLHDVGGDLVSPGSTQTTKFLFIGERGPVDSKSYMITFNIRYVDKGTDKRMSYCLSDEVSITPRPRNLNFIAAGAASAGAFVSLLVETGVDRKLLAAKPEMTKAFDAAAKSLEGLVKIDASLYGVKDWASWAANHLMPYAFTSHFFWWEFFGRAFIGMALAMVVFNAYEITSLKSLTDRVSWRSALLIGFLCGLLHNNVLKVLQALIPNAA